MIQYLKLIQVEPMAYRSRLGCAVKLKFERPGKAPVFGHIHQATQDDFHEWSRKVGQEFAVRIGRVALRPGEVYEQARLFQSFTRDPRNDP